jgi:hypothetical protein
MKTSTNPKWKIAASLACLALLIFAGSASAALVITTTTTNQANPFIPNWTVAPDSLIAGMSPSSVGPGNFASNYGGGAGGGVAVLTDGLLGLASNNGAPDATCGYDNGAGAYLIYTLPPAANGYNITNITTYSGWQDYGLSGQQYAVSYSTIDNPNSFVFLTFVNYAPGGSSPVANRVTLSDSLGGTVAKNVAAIKFDFTTPLQPFGVEAYDEITVEGTPATTLTPQPVVITTSNENNASTFVPSWTLETDSLIAGMSPSATVGDPTTGGEAGTSVLTDGFLGTTGDSSTVAALGSGGGACSSVTYTLTGSANGYDLTNIVTYSAWGDYGRDGQFYSVSYSTVAAPTTFIPLTSVEFNPYLVPLGQRSANRVDISSLTGVLGKNVYSVKFNFPQDNTIDYGFGSYQQIILEGTNSAPTAVPPSPILVQDTVPVYAQAVVGDKVIFTAVYSNSPPASLQWQFISGGVTNNISGATGPALTLNNLQLTNSGSYTLMAVNATNNAAAPSYSTVASLIAATNGLAPIRNILTIPASQTSDGTGFVPTWPVATDSLLAGLSTTTETGDFAQDGASGTYVLTDGLIGPVSADPGYQSVFATAGLNPNNAGGQSLVYTLPPNANGYNLTNITVYSGWADNTADEQAYNVSYATADNPSSFISLATVEFNPSVPNLPTATRVMLTAETGTVIAPNVAALRFDFSAPFDENGYSGYMEITAEGTAAATVTAPPLSIAIDTQYPSPGTSPTWPIETDSLIEGQLPSSVGPGNFEVFSGMVGPSVLTDGSFGFVDAMSSYASCGYGIYSPGQSAGQSLTYNLNGANLTNIVVYNGWTDYGRQGQFYDVYYSTMSAPATFVLLTSIWYNEPFVFSTPVAHRVDISNSTGAALATNVAAVKFDFAPQFDNNIDYGFSGYAQLVLEGIITAPPTAPIIGTPLILGGNLVLTGTRGTPNAGYTWLTTTNLAAPINWTTNITGILDDSGAFSNSIPINVTTPARFFRLRLP